VATIVVNQPDHIEFKNVTAGETVDNAPTVLAQAGNWEITAGRGEAGVMFDVYGSAAPILTPVDARKLAKWLNRAADELEGSRKKPNKSKQRRHYEDDSDDNAY